ncbi:hypothetical protein QCA50_010853 [Cerrena zonata]|uniref:Uncharacterized protein n=1 Tax=Cerrena zonata TaxID=2478898 RepID=A0AAW0G8W7_9APHY
MCVNILSLGPQPLKPASNGRRRVSDPDRVRGKRASFWYGVGVGISLVSTILRHFFMTEELHSPYQGSKS